MRRMPPETAGRSGPLRDVRVIELGSLIAGPFATRILADFGADVIKVEPPGQGDPLREWGLITEKGSLWSLVQSRNKRSVVLDLRQEEDRATTRRLIAECDVVVENFRPGRMEEWGLGYEELARGHQDLVMVRISGFGQTGPYSRRPGFGNIAESMGGIRYITGWPDRPPLRVGLSLGDSIAGLYAVVGTLMALHEARANGVGQVVDVALNEAVMSVLENIIPEYGWDGRVRERTGNILNGAAPSNTYLTRDERWLSIGANGDGIFRRLCSAMGHDAMGSDPRYQGNQKRRAHVEELDGIIGAWTAQHTVAEAMAALNEHGVPAGPVYSVADIAADPQLREREMLQRVAAGNIGEVLMPGVVPRLSRTPGMVRWVGPELGAHTEEVLRELAQPPKGGPHA